MDVKVEYAWERGKRGRPRGPDYEAAARRPLSHPSIYGDLVVLAQDRLNVFTLEASSVDECLDSAFLELLGASAGNELTLSIQRDDLVLSANGHAWRKPDGTTTYVWERKDFRVSAVPFVEETLGAARRFLAEAESAAGSHGRNVMAAFRSALDELEADIRKRLPPSAAP